MSRANRDLKREPGSHPSYRKCEKMVTLPKNIMPRRKDDMVCEEVRPRFRGRLKSNLLILRGDQSLIAQQTAESLNLRLRPVREIGHGSLAALLLLAPAYAEEDGGQWRWGTVSMYRGINIHSLNRMST
jgi:hypothetical protein